MKEAKSKKWTYRAPIVKTVFYLLMSLCLCTASYLALLDPLMYSENPIFQKITMGYIGLPVSLFMLYIFIKKLFNHRKALLIDNRGITDRTNLLSPGLVPWKDITRIKFSESDGLLTLHIFLCQPNTLMTKLNALQRRLIRANLDLGYPPIRIQLSVKDKKCSLQDIKSVISSYHPHIIK